MSLSQSRKPISYARTASEDASRIAAQHAANRLAAAADGYPDVEEVTDDGRSGLNPNRPGLAFIIARAEAGQLACARLYVVDPARLERSPGDVRRRLAELGVAVVVSGRPRTSAALPGATHHKAEEPIEDVAAVVSAYERKLLAERRRVAKQLGAAFAARPGHPESA